MNHGDTGECQPRSPQEALDLMRERIGPVSTQSVGIDECGGRVLGAAVRADRDHPAASISAMDGYALALADVRAGAVPVSATGAIGKPPPMRTPGAAVRIVTGGALPTGTDVVVPRERVVEEGATIRIGEQATSELRAGQNIRPRGANARAGDVVAPAGALVTPALAAALATFGVARPTVFAPVRVGILLTGDELLGVADTPSPYQIRDSNGACLTALLRPHAWVRVLPVARCGDDYDQTLGAVRALLPHVDALITSGGVSMGDRDHVPAALRECGATVLFHKLPQRPGRPMLGAVMGDGRPIFGLPGNPLSTLITARRIMLPALEKSAGLSTPTGPTAFLTLDPAPGKSISLWWHRPVRRTGADRCVILDLTGSGDIPASALSDGFIEMPPDGVGAGPWPFYEW